MKFLQQNQLKRKMPIKTTPKPKGKKRGRKRKSKRYWTDITQIAIMAYRVLPEGSAKREKIYKRFIHEPLLKLVENTKGHNDYVLSDIGYETLLHQTLIHNLSKFHMYKPEKGKAFSYFTIIGRNYIINENKIAYKEYKIRAEMDCMDTERNITNEVYREEYTSDLFEFTDLFCEYWDDNITFHFKKQRDIQIAEAIIHLFKTRENIEEYYKRPLYVMIRERTGIEKTTYITPIMKQIKGMYYDMFKTFQKTGKLIDDENHNLFFY